MGSLGKKKKNERKGERAFCSLSLTEMDDFDATEQNRNKLKKKKYTTTCIYMLHGYLYSYF